MDELNKQILNDAIDSYFEAEVIIAKLKIAVIGLGAVSIGLICVLMALV